MYGTVARFRIASKHRLDPTMFAHSADEEQAKQPRQVAEYLFKLDSDLNEYILVAIFSDRESQARCVDAMMADRLQHRFGAPVETDLERSDGEIVLIKIYSGL